MRGHPVYIILCILFAIALEILLVRRIRQHADADGHRKGRDDQRDA